MQNPKSVSELLANGNKRLKSLQARVQARALVLDQVREALPERLAESVVSAGLEQGRLILGVNAAVWASRLRYFNNILVKRVGEATGTAILSVKIRVVPTRD
jgi:hypothetical protein